MKKEYIAPAVEIVLVEAVSTLEINNSTNTEGSSVLLGWLVD